MAESGHNLPGTYEPPCVEEGSTLDLGQEEFLAPGVLGYAIDKGTYISIPLIYAKKQGSGDVGRFLDTLSPRCRIPNVTSPRLMGMLIRRGFSPVFTTEVVYWERPDNAG
jgi:hypothetical protein